MPRTLKLRPLPGRADGSDQHRANLQAMGEWTDLPQHGELFTTAFSQLNADAATTLPACDVNFSPDLQISALHGELIGPSPNQVDGLAMPSSSPQVVDGTLVVVTEGSDSQSPLRALEA